MSSLISWFNTEFDKYIQNEIKDLEPQVQQLARQIEDIIKGYVPIDTEELKDNIVVQHRLSDEKMGYIIDITIPDIELYYQNKTIKAIKLAGILQAGRGKNGVILKRTSSNTYATAGSVTANWWSDAMMEIERLVG